MQGWFIGLTRFYDQRHHIEDIVAGWLLGLAFAAWFFWQTTAAVAAIGARMAPGVGSKGTPATSDSAAVGPVEP